MTSNPSPKECIVEQAMESKTLRKFENSIETSSIAEDVDGSSAEFVSLNHQILTMSSEAAKLKVLGYMPSISPGRLEMLLKVLEKIISCGMNISVLSDSGIEVDDSELNLQLERKVLTAANACLLSLHIMTSPNLSKAIYQEGVIENILSFTKFQIRSSSYSPLDQVNANDDGGKRSSSERKNSLGCSRKKDMVILNSKLNEIMALLTDFLNIQVLTDVQVLCISSFCLPSLFMEGVADLQLSSLKLITMFTYGHNASINISMFTALILHIIQSAVSFPDGISEDDRKMSVDKLMSNMLGAARKVLTKFLPPFISVCGKRSDTMDLRPLLDSFVTDILITLNNPFWPVSEMIVINLATTLYQGQYKSLVLFFVSKDAHMPLRVLSLEYFGRIVARLRRDGVAMQSKLSSVSKLADRIREELQFKESSEPKEKRMKEEKDDDELHQIQLLQKALLCFLAENGPTDFSSDITRQFYIAQWCVDANDIFSKLDMKSISNSKELPKPKESSVRKTNSRNVSMSFDEKTKELLIANNTTKKRKSKDDVEQESVTVEERNLEKFNLIEDGRRFLITEIKPFEITVTYGNRNGESLLHVGHESAGLISCYFSSKRSFYSSFNTYLKQILFVLTEQNIAIRSKALKCLAMVVEVDPAVLGDPDMLLGVQYSFSDCSASILNPKEDKHKSAEIPKSLLNVCHQIVDCLVENILQMEENCPVKDSEQPTKSKESDQLRSKSHYQRLSACFLTLYLFAKTRPQLLNPGGNQIISYVAKIFELVVPFLEHSSDLLLAQLEEFLMKAILTDSKCVVNDCLSCLSSTIKCRTHNYKLISDCLSNYYDHLRSCKSLHEKDPSDPGLIKSIPYSRRAMYTVGLMLKYFDFSLAEVRNDLPQPDQGLQSFAIQAVGYICIRYTETFFFVELKRLYMHSLLNSNASKCTKLQVLNILEMYLLEEEKKNSKQIQEWSKISKEENLKEMNDVSSGMASAVIQLYLKGILESFIHSSETIRLAVLRVVKNVIQQGLVHPAQSLEGMCLSYKFQKLVQEKMVRGHRIQKDGSHKALIGYFYSILRSKKKERRAIIVAMLKKFDEPGKSSLSEMLYMADNLALLPYGTLDEPHFLIHHMDAFLPENELNSGKIVDEEGSSSKRSSTSRQNSSSAISHLQAAENESSLLGRIPEDTTALLNCLLASQGYMLLLCLREHIKKVYSLKEGKILEYSPSKPNKQYEKTVNRHRSTPFNPEVILKAMKEEPKTDVKGRKSMVKQYLK
ncbi:hypothetical protein J437_LFUL001671, partial [Ladona fulva]